MCICTCGHSLHMYAPTPLECSPHVCTLQDGHLSSTGQCFDCGMTVRSAVIRFSPNPDRRRTDEPPRPFPGSVADWAAGNGSLMRLCPVPLFFHKYPEVALDRSMDSSKVTHGADAATDSCRYVTFCLFLLSLSPPSCFLSSSSIYLSLLTSFATISSFPSLPFSSLSTSSPFLLPLYPLSFYLLLYTFTVPAGQVLCWSVARVSSGSGQGRVIVSSLLSNT